MTTEIARRVNRTIRHPIIRKIIGGVLVTSSFSYLGYLLFRNWNELATYDWEVNYYQAIPMFLCYSIALAFAVLGWSQIMNRVPQTPRKTEWRKHLKYYVYTKLFGRLPAPLLHVLGRVHLYEREGVAKSATILVSVLEWLLTLLSGIVVSLLTLPFTTFLPSVWRSPCLLAGAFGIGVLLLHPRTVHKCLQLMGRGDLITPFRCSDTLVWLVMYATVWVGGGVALYALTDSLYDLPLVQLPTVVSIWALSGLFSTVIFTLLPGFGVKEVTLSLLLGYLIPSPLAVVVALLMRVCLILFDVIWGIVALTF